MTNDAERPIVRTKTNWSWGRAAGGVVATGLSGSLAYMYGRHFLGDAWSGLGKDSIRDLGIGLAGATVALDSIFRFIVPKDTKEDFDDQNKVTFSVLTASGVILLASLVTGTGSDSSEAQSPTKSDGSTVQVDASTESTAYATAPTSAAVTGGQQVTLPEGRCIVNGIEFGTIPSGNDSEEVTTAVKTIQTMLAESGFDPGPIDGLAPAGGSTSQAVDRLQDQIHNSGEPFSEIVIKEDPWNPQTCYFTKFWQN